MVAPRLKGKIALRRKEAASPLIKTMYEMHFKDLASGKRILKRVAPPNENDLLAVKDYLMKYKEPVDKAFAAFQAEQEQRAKEKEATKKNQAEMAEALARASIASKDTGDPEAAAFATAEEGGADDVSDEDE